MRRCVVEGARGERTDAEADAVHEQQRPQPQLRPPQDEQGAERHEHERQQRRAERLAADPAAEQLQRQVGAEHRHERDEEEDDRDFSAATPRHASDSPVGCAPRQAGRPCDRWRKTRIDSEAARLVHYSDGDESGANPAKGT